MPVAFAASTGLCCCTNETCGNRSIPSIHTQRHVDRATGVEKTLAWCSSCDALYEIIRRPGRGLEFGLVTNERTRKTFNRKLAALTTTMQRTDA